MLTIRNPGLLVLCFALIAAACKNASPVDTAPPLGNLWQPCGTPPISAPVTKIVTGRNGILFALIGGSVARSVDTGNTWSAVTASNSGFSKLIIDKEGNLYLGAGSVVRSTNNGNSWTDLGGFIDSVGISSLTLIANEWILTVSYDAAVSWRSTNIGQTWVTASNLPGYGEDVIYDQKTNTVYLKTFYHGANVSLWSSIDNGSTWSHLWQCPSGVNYPDYCMAVDSTGRLWVLDQDGTIFLNSSEVGHSSFGIPYVYRADSTRWQALVLEVDPSGSLLLGGNGFHFSLDGGITWVTNSSGLTDNVVTAIGIQAGGMVLVGTSSGRIYRSTRPIKN